MSAVDDANAAVLILENAITDSRQLLSMRDILQRMRAEYDYIWKACNRDFDPNGPAFSLSEYCAKLETLLLNRFAESGMGFGDFGLEGIAGWEREQEGRQDLAEEAVQRRLQGLLSGLNTLKEGIDGLAAYTPTQGEQDTVSAVMADTVN